VSVRRILKEWAGDVEDDYRDIATECLRFQQLSKKFYDPSLTQGAQRTGAMYRHILAPLYRLVTRKFRTVSELFSGIPESARSHSVSGPHLGRSACRSALVLFDGREATPPGPEKVEHARKFMKYLEEFADKIQHLTEHTTVNDLRDTIYS